MNLTIILALVSTSLALPSFCDQECNQRKALAMFNEAHVGCNIENKGIGIPQEQCIKDGGHLVDDVVHVALCVGFNHIELQAQCLEKAAKWFGKAEEAISAMS
jgi:hypothetical protein